MIKEKICVLRPVWLFFGAFLVVTTAAFAQKPEIKSIDKSNGSMGEVVTIKGENFGTNASTLAVFFGGAKGAIQSVTNQVIEVKVPSGATFDKISVVNKASGLTGYTTDKFLLSFGGSHPFLGSMLETQVDFNAQKGLQDLCLCDLDGDNKLDVTTASDDATSFSILPNTSSGPGNVSFNTGLTPIAILTKSLHPVCGDLDGDGKPDLVISEGGDGDRLFVLRNTSTGPGNFTFDRQIVRLTGRKTNRMRIADLDLDGKPELIVTDQGSPNISVLVNQSTPGAITFATMPITINIPDGAVKVANTDGVDVADLNGDNFPEIVTSQFIIDGCNLFIIENNSVRGTINMGSVTEKTINKAVVEIHIGDLDGDAKADIAVSRFIGPSLTVFRNESTSASFSFAAPEHFVTDTRPYGFDLGDLDGDGKTDIAVTSHDNKSITILNNESTPGSLSFQQQIVSTDHNNKHVRIGDVDSDGKPDLVFASIDDAPTNTTISKVSVMRNTNCLIPEVTPEGPVSACIGFPLQLLATEGRGITYEWTNTTTSTVVASGSDPFLDVAVSGEYQVKATSEGGACSELSNIVNVDISAGAISGTAAAANNGPLCIGSDLELEVTGVTGTDLSYKWSGPAGYTGSGATPPAVTDFQEENIGRYTVEVYAGTCLAQKASTVVEAIDIGSFEVSVPGSKTICQGDSKTLTVSPNLAGTTFQWYKGATALTGETNTTLTVTETGEYYTIASYPGCTPAETNRINITVAAIPTAAFSMPTEACAGQLVQFTNKSAADGAATPAYTWTFGDGDTSNEENPNRSYASAGTFQVKLRVTYEGGACPNESPEKPITITAAPVPAITNPGNNFQVCQGDSLKLEVLGTYNSYLWNTGATSSSIYIKQAGTFSVEVTTDLCTLNADRDVTALSAPAVTIQADPEQISEGQSTQLTADGLLSYAWLPEETLSDASVANPVAAPLVTTTYTVTGEGLNGCRGEASIQVHVKGDAIVTKLSPKNFFSPNDDASNQQWVVGNILDFPQCGVAIYDDKGVKVYEAKPYLNDWNGTFNGKNLPQGVYFYIIKCDGEENTPKAGSITILR